MHLVKEAVDEQRLDIRHCNTKNMIADGFTKPLEGVDFKQFINNLNIFPSKNGKSQPGSVEQ
jgi:hypothetical protein